MAGNLYQCTFEPGGESVRVEPGTTVLDAARLCGVSIQATCGGRLTCGTCGVRIVSGELMPPEDDEASKVGKSGVRLSCRARIAGDVTVRPVIAPRTRIVSQDVSPTIDSEQLNSKTIENFDCSKARLSAGVDLGTTTVSAVVADSDTLTVVGEAHALNSQMSFGGDVLSRLSLALESSDNLIALRDEVQKSILEALELAAPGRLRDLDHITIAANTVMASLLVGSPAHGLAAAPFSAPDSFLLESGPLLEALTTCTTLTVLKPLAGFVGGDTAAGLIAACSRNPKLPLLFVDLGTNVEVALVTKERIMCASAPAGSAFAAAGGIGSDTLQALHSLRQSGILDAGGLLDEAHEQVARDQFGIMHVASSNISQLDIRDFQLAKAAVATCIELLLKESKVNPEEVNTMMVTGLFGIALHAELFFELGILPASLRHAEVVEFISDMVVDGALKVSLDKESDAPSFIHNRPIKGLDLVSSGSFQDVLVARLRLEPTA